MLNSDMKNQNKQQKSYHQQIKMSDISKKTIVKPKYCHICKKSGHEGYFCLPSKPDARKLWIEACNLPLENIGDIRICFRHFDVANDVQVNSRCYKVKPSEYSSEYCSSSSSSRMTTSF